MKKISFFIAILCISTSIEAQKVNITLTEGQYEQVKKEVVLQQKTDKLNSDWAQFKKYEQANNQLTRIPEIVFMGNSITELWVHTHPDFFTKHNFLGRGISGQTSSEMLVRFRSDVIDLHPKFVIINAGTNDIARNNGMISKEHIMQNIISMAELAKINHIKPVLSSVLPTNHYSWSPIQPAEEVMALNTMIKKYAKKNGLKYIDYYSVLVDNQKGLPQKYSKDGVHPTPAGYDIMEKTVLKIFGIK